MAGTPLREILASFGIEMDTQALQRGADSIGNAIEAVGSLGRAVAATALVQGVSSFVQSMIDTGSELHDTAAAMGLSATELAGWRHAAGMAGVEASQLSGALARVSVIARNHPATFARLGVAVRDASGEYRTSSALLEDVGTAIGSIENETERTAAAVQVFGRSGRALIPMFARGAESVSAMREEVRLLYGTDLDRLAEVSDDAGDAEDRLALRMDALRTRLALSVLPALTEGIDRLIGWSTQLVEVTRNSRAMEAAIFVAGAAAAAAAILTIGAWGPPVAVFLVTALAVGVLIGLIDDLIVMFEGGESVIGDFLDELFGIGTAAAVVQTLSDAFAGVLQFVNDTIAAVQAFARDPSIDSIVSALQPLSTLIGGRGAGADTVAEAGLNTPTGGAAERWLEEHRRSVESGTAAPGSGGGPVSVALTTGPINVTGASEPVETARRTTDAIRERAGGMMSDAAADLVPINR